MNRWLLASAILLSVLSSGCGTFWEYAATNLLQTPINAASDCARHKRLVAEGNKYYHEFQIEHPDEPCSEDFCQGFNDGFVDYVEMGGDGEAPPNPPHKYLRVRYDTPAGRQAMLDYQNGFRQGSIVAMNSGLRELVVIRPGQAAAPSTDPDQKMESNPTNDKPAERTLPTPRMEPAEDGPVTRLENNP